MIHNSIKVIFAGTPEFALPFYRAIIKDDFFEIVGIITRPDKPVGRKQTLTPPPVKLEALKNDIKIIQPEKISEYDTKEIKKLNADLLIVVAYGQILPKYFLDIFPSGVINVHPSLLPKYRGSSPIQSAILNGDKKTGISIMLLDQEMDHGPLLCRKKVKINKNETGVSLHNKLADFGAPLLINTIKKYQKNKIKPKAQNHNKATYCKQITKNNAKIDWHYPAKKIERMIRAYYSWPVAWMYVGDKRVKIFPPVEVIKIKKNDNLQIGDIIQYQNNIAVKCSTALIHINKLQIEGKRVMTADEFVRGHQSFFA